MAGKFEVYRDRQQKYRFRLVNDDGEILLTGEAYESKQHCLKGLESVRKHAGDASIVEME